MWRYFGVWNRRAFQRCKFLYSKNTVRKYSFKDFMNEAPWNPIHGHEFCKFSKSKDLDTLSKQYIKTKNICVLCKNIAERIPTVAMEFQDLCANWFQMDQNIFYKYSHINGRRIPECRLLPIMIQWYPEFYSVHHKSFQCSKDLCLRLTSMELVMFCRSLFIQTLHNKNEASMKGNTVWEYREFQNSPLFHKQIQSGHCKMVQGNILQNPGDINGLQKICCVM